MDRGTSHIHPPNERPVRAGELLVKDHRLIINFLFQLMAMGYGAAFGYHTRLLDPGFSVLGHGVPMAIHLYVMLVSIQGFGQRQWADRLILIGQLLISLVTLGVTVLWVAGVLYLHR